MKPLTDTRSRRNINAETHNNSKKLIERNSNRVLECFCPSSYERWCLSIYYQLQTQASRKGDSLIPEHYEFESLYELEKIAEDNIEDVEDAPVLVYDRVHEETQNWPYRTGKITEDSRKVAGVVSSNPDFYQTFQYPDILQDTVDAIRRKQQRDDLEFTVSGDVEIADDYHKMRMESIFDGNETTITLDDTDAIKVGLNETTGHSGFHGFKIQPAALREICSNGMKGWVADHTFQLNHNEEYNPAVISHGVDAVVNGTEEMKQRLQKAQNQYLVGGKDELRVLMHEMIGEYLDSPVGDIPLSLEEEVGGDQVSRYEAYQSMSRALSHHPKSDMPQYKIDEGFERAAQLLETGSNQLPDAQELGRQAVERRAKQVIEDPDVERYFENEDETLRELMQEHELTA